MELGLLVLDEVSLKLLNLFTVVNCSVIELSMYAEKEEER